MPNDDSDLDQRPSTLLLECWVEDAYNHCLTRHFHFESNEGFKQFAINILFIPHKTNLRLSITEDPTNKDVTVSICRKTFSMEEGILELMASVEEVFQKVIRSHEFARKHPIFSWFQSIGKPRC